MFRSLQTRRALSSIAALGLLLSTASAGEKSDGVFDDLRQSPFKSEQSAATDGKLVDLTKPLAADDVKLTSGADFFDTGLVANNGRLLGLFARSDYAFRDFISPVSNPLFFEDPRTLTELRVHFANQWVPGNNPVFQGGNVQYIAAQIRVALTERLSIVAGKDGYLWLNPGNAALGDREGWADVAAGLKYNLIRRPETQFLYSVARRSNSIPALTASLKAPATASFTCLTRPAKNSSAASRTGSAVPACGCRPIPTHAHRCSIGRTSST